jgi:hypothetical protein
MTPEVKERVLATVNELIDEDGGCYGRDSYEHYLGECAHFEEEEDDGPDSDYEFERRWDDGEGR